MVKIIMHGCNGHMGQVITGLVKEDAWQNAMFRQT